MKIQRYSAHQADEIARLFHLAVHAIDSSIYNQAQKNAWAPTPIDYQRWRARLAQKQPLVAMIEDRITGFIELDGDGHIDCTYTHPDFQRRGVAAALFEQLLQEAKQRQLKRLYVEASLLAKPFFEQRGFSLIKQNQVQRNGVSLVNFSMEKQL
ncbi:histone acetyltransferase [Shewanella mangrovi]|uniref:Histone acetyltransferase n=1 Tax=Shewanella mangrovi TaxID=1515746 RepID=A0A094JFI5_9GAMM|nr:histone acetyltransferase [Shewanella mangrovi]